MSWIALHTAPSIDPHCTLAWWPDTKPEKDREGHEQSIAILNSFNGEDCIWGEVTGYEEFGVRKDIEVALLRESAEIATCQFMTRKLHESTWGQRAHVTAHDERQIFKFAWLGLHLPTRVMYWRFQ